MKYKDLEFSIVRVKRKTIGVQIHPDLRITVRVVNDPVAL